MFAFLGYAPAVLMTLVGGLGLLQGAIPLVSYRRVSGLAGFRVWLACLLMIAALPLAVWLGQRTNDTEELLELAATADRQSAERTDAALAEAEALRERLNQAHPHDPQAAASEAILTKLRTMQAEASGADDVIRQRLARRLHDLEPYEVLFSRLLFSGALLLLALQVVPPEAKARPRRLPNLPAASGGE
jgi:signal transduction histidine kinase